MVEIQASLVMYRHRLQSQADLHEGFSGCPLPINYTQSPSPEASCRCAVAQAWSPGISCPDFSSGFSLLAQKPWLLISLCLPCGAVLGAHFRLQSRLFGSLGRIALFKGK